MAFTWTNSPTNGTIVGTSEYEEVNSKMDTLAAAILDPSPTVADVATPNLDLVATGEVVLDDVYDEIQNRLNHLRENNWCRAYAESGCSTEHTTYYNTLNSALESTVYTTRYDTNNSSLCNSQHLGYYATNRGTNHLGVCGTRYGFNYSKN